MPHIILHINSYYYSDMFYRKLFEAQAALGETVKAAVPHIRGAAFPDHGSFAEGLACFDRWDRPFFFLRYSKAYRAVLNSIKGKSAPDIIHAHSLFSNGYVAWRLSREIGAPFVTAVRDTDINVFLRYKPYLAPLMRRMLSDASGVVFISETLRESGLKKYLDDREFAALMKKSRTIPNGLDPFWLDNINEGRREPHTPLRILCVGKIIPRKNMLCLARAVKSLNENGFACRLTIVGKRENENLAGKLESYDNIYLLPARPMRELIDVYRENDVFALASTRETFGLVYAEALSQGLPVIYSSGRGFDGNFPEGIAGFSVDPDDARSVSRGITLAKEHYGEISERAPKLASRFNWNAIARQYSDFYDDMLNGRQR